MTLMNLGLSSVKTSVTGTYDSATDLTTFTSPYGARTGLIAVDKTNFQISLIVLFPVYYVSHAVYDTFNTLSGIPKTTTKHGYTTGYNL